MDNLKDNHQQKEKEKQKLSLETYYKNTDQPPASKGMLRRCPEKEGRKRQAVAKQENSFLEHLCTCIRARDAIEKTNFPSWSAL